ncbi:MAG: hypothetical protein LBE37_07060 [Sphingobacterium sp.]|jgi:hypothetical protein|nr:hypothetical protein [Sphingobacterium sp.]
MKKRAVFITIFVFFIVVNLPVINTEILKRVDGDHFRYSNADASFTYIQFLDVLQPWISDWTVARFARERHPSEENKQVFRIYRINPLCFWRWRYYWVVSRNFEYRSWKQIEPQRTPRIPDNMWQQF